MTSDTTPNDISDAEYIRTAVSELNESIAYLSKMVLQLQRSINENTPKNTKKANPAQTVNSTKKEPPITIH